MNFSTVPASDALSAEILSAVNEWASHQRWYPGEPGSHAEPWLVGRWHDGSEVLILFARLDQTVLQIPLLVTVPGAGVGDLIVEDGGAAVYDGARQPAVWREYLNALDDSARAEISDDALREAKLLPGEQSNSSVMLPNWAETGAMMKILRTLAPGEHPDVSVPRALTAAGFDGVPAFLGAVPVTLPDFGETDLAILAALVADAEDGFELAVKYASQNRDFSELAASFGATLAGLHRALAEAIASDAKLDPEQFTGYLQTRADAAIADAPSLQPLRQEIADKYAALAAALAANPPQPLQQIHGDLHLGQVLYGQRGWQILDFEGEPLRPVAERTAPDLPMRDVAGMLRSFDYAGAVGNATDPNWVSRAQDAFLAAYLAEVGTTATSDRDDELRMDILRALTLDKALCEVVYETRQRPAWLQIPLSATERLLHRGE